MKCKICDTDPIFKWTDTHGIGVCCYCGMPYKIIHYDNGKRIDKDPEIAVKEEWVAIARKYFNETKSTVFPACYDIGIFPTRGSSYSGATLNDIEEWRKWLDDHEDEIPKSIDEEIGE